ncbi:FAD-dependent oxidoreductase [Pseudaminobacter soli (ex Li et al. 2025)]|nr:FAD-dependent oxidoreductase [Mesorhizobium soli]
MPIADYGRVCNRSILIAGGGPVGMKAAVVAAERGHQVTLFERSRRLGGQARLAEMLPGRAEFGGLIVGSVLALSRCLLCERLWKRTDLRTPSPSGPMRHNGASAIWRECAMGQ